YPLSAFRAMNRAAEKVYTVLRQEGTQKNVIDIMQTRNELYESFLVSLALALALSDLVSHKTRIDSLFLDEGFGTLDSETLDA
ncbi:SbcC/MukB-like Walker B domain-containing protein, partial [Salmonella enterica subsp. enterica serovar Anatum]|nr:SbcC/MukB-like Walker B domain-containing protein [Salmonella enterica subsp. enterica serovar Anatum]